VDDDVGRIQAPAVHHQLRALRHHTARDERHVRSSRCVDRRPELGCGGGVAEGGIGRKHAGEQQQPLVLVDGVVEVDHQIVGQPQERRSPEAGPRQAGGASGCRRVDGWQRHPPTFAARVGGTSASA
jgi:hypothetical protein